MARQRRIAPPIKALTDRQKYLLQRIPNQYQLDGYRAPEEPHEIKKARALIARYDKRQSIEQCKAKRRALALREKAREAVYFHDDQTALAIVRQCEKMLKGCED